MEEARGQHTVGLEDLFLKNPSRRRFSEDTLRQRSKNSRCRKVWHAPGYKFKYSPQLLRQNNKQQIQLDHC